MRINLKLLVAIIYAIVLFLDRLDLTVVNITLPTLSRVFHVPITSTDWVNLSFLLALAISIPISGWLGQRFGFKKIYVLAMVLFGAGSTLCAFSPNLTILILLRFIHGIGGGMLIPVGMTIIYRIYDKAEYASITSFTFIPSLVAPAIAPFLGGILLDNIGWQTVFLLSGPICLILAVITFIMLPEDKEDTCEKLDWQGFVLFSSILIDVFYSLSLIGKNHLVPYFVMGCCLLPLLIFSFIRREKGAMHPLIDLNYFRNEIFFKANLVQLCFQICHFGAIFLIGMYLQVGVGLSASLAGLIMGMQAVGAIVTSRYSVRLFNFYGAKFPITIGLAGVAILSPLILLVGGQPFVWAALLLFFTRGIFSGLCGTPIQTLTVINFEKDEIASANTISNACRQVSISLGVAISSGLMTIGMYYAKVNNFSDIIKMHSLKVFAPGFFIIPVVAVIGILIIQSLDENKIKTYDSGF